MIMLSKKISTNLFDKFKCLTLIANYSGVYDHSLKYESIKKTNNLSYSLTDTAGLSLNCSNIGDRLRKIAKEKPNHLCYKFCLTQTSFTFLELDQRVDELAQNLINIGFKKGDRLALLLPNVPEINLAILAAARIGVIIVLMNPAYQKVEIEYILKKTRAKGIIILDNLKTLKHYEIIAKLCSEIGSSKKGELKSSFVPDLKHVIIVNNRLIKDTSSNYNGTWNFSELEKFNQQYKQTPYVDMDDSFAILFTVE
jgi:acyl-CoA synthetase (AMP-forming)/AMP-acid ligase II